MGVHPTVSVDFEDDTQRAIYEYVERRGAVTRDELARGVSVEAGTAQSKPARSATYVEATPLEPEQLRASVEALKENGHLVETNGKLRVGLSATPVEHDTAAGTVTIRPAREEDRDGLVAAMRDVAREDTYVVAENVAEAVQRESALVRANEERSRVFFVADLADADAEAADETDAAAASEPDATGQVVGWLHLDAPELPSLRHAAELTVGVVDDHRREGIGSHLVSYGLEWADDAGYRKVYQSVPATNDRAIEFLEANDWEREGERTDHYLIDDAFVDEVLLARWV